MDKRCLWLTQPSMLHLRPEPISAEIDVWMLNPCILKSFFKKKCHGGRQQVINRSFLVTTASDTRFFCFAVTMLLLTQLLTEEEHQRFLELRLSIAESCSEHSFHCQTPNCRGWCIYEDEVNEFHCQICGQTSCILCRVVVSLSWSGERCSCCSVMASAPTLRRMCVCRPSITA